MTLRSQHTASVVSFTLLLNLALDYTIDIPWLAVKEMYTTDIGPGPSTEYTSTSPNRRTHNAHAQTHPCTHSNYCH